MRTIRWIVGICVGFLTAVCAQDVQNFGAGIAIGSPIAATGKFWINHTRAIDVGVGASGDLTLYADHLWHGWKVFSQPKGGKLAAYLGLGLRWEDKHNDDEFGFRGVTGIGYWPNRYSLELFAELAPVLRVTPKTDGDLDLAVGVRYYFEGFN